MPPRGSLSHQPGKGSRMAAGLALLWILLSALPGTAQPEISDAQTNAVESYKQMSLEELMRQEVTSVSREPQPYLEAPAAIQVITGDQIRESGASSLPEALRLADNLDVAQVSSLTWDISARGFNPTGFSDKLLVLMDGRSIYTPLLAGVIWNMQDYLLADIDRIEVISGPGGSVWGANAVNGVINIISKNARDTQGLYTEAGAGNWLEDFVGARYGGTLATNVYYRVYGKYFDRGGEVYADGRNANDWWNRGQGGFRIDADRGINQWTLQGDIFGGNSHTTAGGEGTPPARSSTAGGNILGRWTHSFSDDSQSVLQIYYDRTHLQAPFQSANFGVAIPAGSLYDDLDTFDIDFQHSISPVPWDHVIWGLGYRFTHDQVANAPLVAFLPAQEDLNLFSGFLEDQIKFPHDVTLTLGTKLEHNDYTGFEYEPSARLQWSFTANQMVWGAISRAVRMPSRYDRDLFEPSPGYLNFLGSSNSTFQSETVIAYELGYRSAWTKRVSSSVSLFYNDYDNLRSTGYSSGGLPLVFQNGLAGHTYGGEFSIDYQLFAWWRWHAGYDYLQEDIHPKAGVTDVNNGLAETADPKHQVFLRSSLDLPAHVTLDANLRWIDSIVVNNGPAAGEVPAYWELDTALTWHPTRNLEVALVGQNLLHDQHPEAGFPGPNQEQIVRSIYGRVSWAF